MKKYLVVTAVSCSIAFMAAVPARAQFIEDALRLSQVGPGVGARSLSMGSASLGLADDFSATYSNPAGLAQSGLNELNFGMSTLGYDNSASFYGNTQSMSNNSTELNSVGMMWSVPTTRGHLSFSLGYGRQADFNSALSFAGFNPKSSIIQSWAPDNTSYLNQDLSTNIAYQLYLANIDTLTGRFVSPIKNNVTQSGTVLEGGGLNYWSGAGSIEAARNLYLGMSLDFISGS